MCVAAALDLEKHRIGVPDNSKLTKRGYGNDEEKLTNADDGDGSKHGDGIDAEALGLDEDDMLDFGEELGLSGKPKRTKKANPLRSKSPPRKRQHEDHRLKVEDGTIDNKRDAVMLT